MFSDSNATKNIKLGGTNCAELIREVLSPYFKNVILEDIGDQKFSLILNESTDISVSKMLGIVIRYFSKNNSKIVNTFFDLLELESGTAEYSAVQCS